VAARAVRTTAPATDPAREFIEHVLDTAGVGLSVVVVPAPAATLTTLPKALDDDVVSLWHGPGDRSFVGVGVAAALDIGDGLPRSGLRDAVASLLGRVRVEHHREATPVRPALVGGLGFAEGWRDAPWDAFGDGSFVLHRWTYERSQGGTLALAVDGSTLDAQATSDLLSEYDRIVEGLRVHAGEALFPTFENGSGDISGLAVRQRPMAEWIAHVRSIQRELERGGFSKIVAARRCQVRLSGEVDPAAVVARLAHDFPECTAFLFRRGERSFVGATPETLFTTRGSTVASHALAGSLQVAAGEAADKRDALLGRSRKNLGEHEVVVRAIVSGLADHCVSVVHPPRPEILRVRNLIHLSTPIRGELRDGTHPVEVLEALHPTPAVGGVPRQESVRWIVEHEAFPRGWYTGPIGWIDIAADATFRVAIRCGLLEPGGAFVHTGAGIVPASNPAAEYHETSLKQRPFLRALAASA
jgi:isochorismate synthase